VPQHHASARMVQVLITVFVFAFTLLYYSRFRYITRWWKRLPTVRDRAFDLAELDLPEGWRPGHDLNERAGIEAVDLLHNRYAIVVASAARISTHSWISTRMPRRPAICFCRLCAC
jgi:hypothetical protein